jgi:flagellar hook assembly protein FlgD
MTLYEWDFTNDGIWDYSSGSQAATSFTYNEPGSYVAAFRVTDEQGQTGIDWLNLTVNLNASLRVADSDKTFDPWRAETMGIDVILNASVPAYLDIKDESGNVIRSLPVTTPALPQRVEWDGKDENSIPVTDGLYFAVLRYQFQGSWQEYDVTLTSGGQRDHLPRGYGCNRRAYFQSYFKPFDDELQKHDFTLCEAQEVTMFIGPLWTGTDQQRMRTIVERQVFPAGTSTIYWDGLDDNGNVAQAPPGDNLITGAWRYKLSDNAIYLTGGRPQLTAISATPNYFSPFSEKCDTSGNSEGIVLDYTLSEDVVTVELLAYSLENSTVLRTLTVNNVLSGDNTIFWDGKNTQGEYVDIGDYLVGLIAKDGDGNNSMLRYTLVRVDY